MSRNSSLSLTLIATLVGVALFGCGGGGRLADGGTPFGAGVGSLALRITSGGVQNRGTSLIRAVPPEVVLFEIHVQDGNGTDLVPFVQVNRPTGNTPVSVTIENVPVGDVIVLVLGLDASRTVLAADKTRVTVEEGLNRAVSVTPSPIPSPRPSPSTSTSPSPSPTAIQRFAVVGNEGDNTITSYLVSTTTGLLTRKFTIGTGAAPVGVDANLARNTVYVADQTARTVSAFRIDATGVMSLFDVKFPVATTGTPNAVVAEGTGKFVYTAVAGPDQIEGVQVNPLTGEFVRAVATAATVPSQPVAIKWLPPNYIIVALQNEVKAFTYGNNGDLTLMDFKTVGSGIITGIAVRPPEPGRNFGLVYAAVDESTNSRVEAYSVDPDPTVGTVTFLGSVSTAGFPHGITTSVGIDFVYVGSIASPTITILKVDPATGTLAARGTFTLTGTGERVQAMSMTGVGRLLFATLSTGEVETCTINQASGGLTVAGARALTGSSPRSIVVF